MRKLFILHFLLISFLGFSQKIEKLSLKKYKIAILSDSLQESSGLTNLDGRLFSFNDSGNTSEIFEIKIRTNRNKITRLVGSYFAYLSIRTEVSTILVNSDTIVIVRETSFDIQGSFLGI